MSRATEAAIRAETERCRSVIRGCIKDLSGGYRTAKEMAIFYHGLATALSALEADPKSLACRLLEFAGRLPDAKHEPE